MWQTYFQPLDIAEALGLVERLGPSACIVAGATDVIVELRRGVRSTASIIDISRIDALRYIRRINDVICIGALATHNDVLAAPLCRAAVWPLVQASREVGAPQIRTRGTVVGNVVTASPANDTITPLVALEAELQLVRPGRTRTVPIAAFYPDFRKTGLEPGEIVAEIRIPALKPDQRAVFIKLGLRRAQAIAVINCAVILTIQDDRVTRARIAFGCVSPTIRRLPRTESLLIGRTLDPATITAAATMARTEVSPISDLRGSAAYRIEAVDALMRDALERLGGGSSASGIEEQPVLLETSEPSSTSLPFLGAVETIVNGTPVVLRRVSGKTLLSALRDDVDLKGTKEGCSEGECGACTVWMDGQAVMSCLVPAARAHGTRITTIEGLGKDGQLHPVQESFVQQGAVQCGYCIPGFIMSAAKLLEEQPAPNLPAIRTALSGNVCRCTGYRKIYDAVLAAGRPS